MQRNGSEEQELIPCQQVLLDYNAFELRPAPGIDAPDLLRDAQGFIEVNRRMETNIPGVFAAGDITGLYSTVAKAIGEGITAGFSAYRYVFRKKFGCEPYLFAYAAQDFVVPPNFRELPTFNSSLKPKLLCRPEEVQPLVQDLKLESEEELLEYLNGTITLEEIVQRGRWEELELMEFLTLLVERKSLTFHL